MTRNDMKLPEMRKNEENLAKVMKNCQNDEN
jgi:hypothetical protein